MLQLLIKIYYYSQIGIYTLSGRNKEILMSTTGTEFNANYLRNCKYKKPPLPPLPTNINAIIYLESFEPLHSVFDGVQDKSSSLLWLLLLLMLLSYTPPCRHGALRRLRLLLLPWQSEIDLQSLINPLLKNAINKNVMVKFIFLSFQWSG